MSKQMIREIGTILSFGMMTGNASVHASGQSRGLRGKANTIQNPNNRSICSSPIMPPLSISKPEKVKELETLLMACLESVHAEILYPVKGAKKKSKDNED
jgi:hypothetical protein